MANPGGSNPFSVIYKFAANPAFKALNPEFRQELDQNFQRLATLISNQTVLNLSPAAGNLIVGTGTKWGVQHVGLPGEVLVVNPLGTGYLFETFNQADPMAKVKQWTLEEIQLLLDEIDTLMTEVVDLMNASALPSVVGSNRQVLTADPTQPGGIAWEYPPAIFTATNQSGIIIQAGQTVSITSTGVVLANATDTTKPCDGLALGGVSPGFSGAYQSSGQITVSDWTNATGGAALQAGKYYYQAVTGGSLTPTKPTSGVCQVVGKALTTTTMDVHRQPVIGL